jgi:hypothetical protein
MVELLAWLGMTHSELVSVGSFIGGFAALIPLVFLYFQLRQLNAQLFQTERNQRALMNQGLINRSSEITRWFAEPRMVGLTARVLAGETQFTAEDLLVLGQALRLNLTSAQDAFVQHKAGLADQISLDNAMGAMQYLLAQPVYRALWKVNRARFAPEWATVVDRLIEEMPRGKPHDIVADFQVLLAEVPENKRVTLGGEPPSPRLDRPLFRRKITPVPTRDCGQTHQIHTFGGCREQTSPHE